MDLLHLFLLLVGASAAEIYVDPNSGDDSASGTTADDPLKTLGAAITSLDDTSAASVINLAAGIYDLSESGITLTSKSNTPVTLEGPDTGEARLLAGKTFTHRPLDQTTDAVVWAAVPAASRSKIRVADVTAMKTQLGNTRAMSAVEGESVVFVPKPVDNTLDDDDYANSLLPSEPFFGRFPLSLAQWPNRDDPEAARAANATDFRFTRVAGQGTVVTTTTHFKTWRFPYMLQSRASVPFKDWTDWEDVVCLGFWTVDWFSAYAPCTKSNEQMTAVIDDDGNEGTLDALEMDLPTALDNDAGLGDVNAGARFAVLNSYDGLDAPGEYVLKRKDAEVASSVLLYFIPPTSSNGMEESDLASVELVMSALQEPIVTLEQSDANDKPLSVRGVTLEAGKGIGLACSDCHGTMVDRVRVLNIGTKGIEVSGNGVTVQRSMVQNGGGKALLLSGGDTTTLVSGNSALLYNTVSFSPRRSLHYSECLDLGGVNMLARGNLIYGAPTAVVELAGNNHVLEYNTIHHVALDAFDTGAVHWAAFDPAQTGHVFRHNFIHHIGYKANSPCSASTSCLLAGIYADDGSYGGRMEGNIFWLPQPTRTITPSMGLSEWFSEDVSVMGVFENAGSRNTVVNNVVIESHSVFGSSGGFLVSGWDQAKPPVAADSDFWTNMREKQWNKAPYSDFYPWLATMVDNYPTDCGTNPNCALAPFGDTISGNIGIDIGPSGGPTKYYNFEEVETETTDVYYDFIKDFDMQGTDTNIDVRTTLCTSAGWTQGTVNTQTTLESNRGSWDEDSCVITVTPNAACGLTADIHTAADRASEPIKVTVSLVTLDFDSCSSVTWGSSSAGSGSDDVGEGEGDGEGDGDGDDGDDDDDDEDDEDDGKKKNVSPSPDDTINSPSGSSDLSESDSIHRPRSSFVTCVAGFVVVWWWCAVAAVSSH